MKLFLAGLSGFVLTLAIFATGAIFAVYFTTAEPIPAWELDKGSRWTVEPAVTLAEPVERLPAKPLETEMAATQDPEPRPVDLTTTGVIPDQETDREAEPVDAQARDETMAHMRWCSERYRSYRPEDNSYRSYSGVRRECVSPLNAASFATDDRAIDAAEPTVDETYVAVSENEATAFMDSRHIASCFARYRSYNPGDNSYQPYGRRSRQQCE